VRIVVKAIAYERMVEDAEFLSGVVHVGLFLILLKLIPILDRSLKQTLVVEHLVEGWIAINDVLEVVEDKRSKRCCNNQNVSASTRAHLGHFLITLYEVTKFLGVYGED
jgi:hypothetical protein